MKSSKILGFVLVLFICGLAEWAGGAPPENADPALHDWFTSLHNADGTPCCAQSDGRPVEYRVNGDHYEALVGKQFPDGPEPPIWVEVPRGKVLVRAENPTGRAILFWRPYMGVLCFVLPPQT